MKRLSIDWHALEMAFDDHPNEFGIERANYFDLESGEVVVVDEHIRSTVNCIIDELDEILDDGASRARKKAAAVLLRAQEACGLKG